MKNSLRYQEQTDGLSLSPTATGVAAILVAWNSGQGLWEAVGSTLAGTRRPEWIIVVDNGSSDGSVEQVEARFPEVQVLRSGRNLGYTGGNNLGIKLALERGAQYLWLLNDDVLVAADALELLLAEAEARPEAGLLGPLVLTREKPDVILTAGGVLAAGWFSHTIATGEGNSGQLAAVAEVDYLSGCALLASRRFVQQVGLLDERFFMYYEDVDWGMRAKTAGFEVVAVRSAKVWHPDTRRRDDQAASVTYYIARNQLFFLQKHRAGYAVMARALARYGRTLLSWSVRPRWRGKRAQRDALVLALRDFGRGRFGRTQ
jgi:GT2 family glycosyltransferase